MKVIRGESCNKCTQTAATKEFDAEPLCDSCAVDRLIEEVEKLLTAWVSVTAEVLYDTTE